VQHVVLYLMLAAAYAAGAVELRNALTSRFGVELPATVTLDYPSISALAGYIASNSDNLDSGAAEPGIAAQDVADTAPDVNVETIR
jgi:Phosphopantetheine attachment site